MAIQPHTTPTRRSALRFSAAAIVAGIATAATASTKPDADAELIALCELFVQNEAKQAGLYITIRDDDERDAALEPLSAEWNDLLDRFGQIDGPPKTMAGAIAMARAALATTPLNQDGEPEIGLDPEDWFNFHIAQFIRSIGA